MTSENKISSTDIVTQEKVELKKPKLYKVILLNDDYTPMEYVVKLIRIVFRKSESEAVNIMLMVHKKGSGICGIFTKEVAETKVETVLKMAKGDQHPFKMHYGGRLMISDELEKTLQRTQKYAKSFKHQYMTLEHLLLSMLEDEDVIKVMNACQINIETLRENLEKFVEVNLKDLISISAEKEIKPTLGFQRVIQRAVIHVQSSGKEEANAANVLVAIFSERESHAVYFLQQLNLNRLDVVNFLSHGIEREKEDEILEDVNDDESKPNQNKNSNDAIENYCVNLNKKAIEGKIDPIIGREKEINRTIHVLARRNKNNPIFVGDPGVGKTALAEGLALKITKKEVPSILKNSKIYSLDFRSFVGRNQI